MQRKPARLLECQFSKGSIAALALASVPARFSHTPTPAEVSRNWSAAHVKEQTKKYGSCSSPNEVSAEWSLAEISDLRLGAHCSLHGWEEQSPMVVLEKNRSQTARRPLLMLLPDGSFNSFELDAGFRLVHAALTSGEAVTVDRQALELVGWMRDSATTPPASSAGRVQRVRGAAERYNHSPRPSH